MNTEPVRTIPMNEDQLEYVKKHIIQTYLSAVSIIDGNPITVFDASLLHNRSIFSFLNPSAPGEGA